MIVLALNSGSSSLKFGVYQVQANAAEALLEGELGSIGQLAEQLRANELPAVDAIGHRIVHGGPALSHHVVLNSAVLRQIEDASAFAPLHAPASLEIIAHTSALFPATPQVVCFDTAFHATLPDTARVLPIPKALQAQGIHRYGFHGVACESILFQLGRDREHGAPSRVLIAHLGHGASVTAVRNGRSVDNSMGLTPCGGVVMGTRSGDLDPGVLIHLLRHAVSDADGLENMLDRHSGLLGISGLSSDMRRLHEAEAANEDARLAVRMFCIAVAKRLAAMTTVLGGVDLIVFSGGIGENDAEVRTEICASLGWFGVALDGECNRRGHGVVSAPHSRCEVRVVKAQEGEQIARHTARLVPR